MARLPTVAIIGRPNTGKSTLFNRLTGTRKAIVSSIAGTTRDHVAQRVDDERMSYLLLDTGGIGGGSEDKDLEDDVSAQSMIALTAADLILFTINGREELTKSDHVVADVLRRKRKRHVPVILVATKCDREGLFEERMAQYYELGIADRVIGVSAVHALGVPELEDVITEQLKALHFQPPQRPKTAGVDPESDGDDGEEVASGADEGDASHDDALPPRIAILGKPNVGKSSLVNALMSDPQRETSPRLVSDIPGTTRDASDTVIRFQEKDYVFIDTAGLRRRAKVEEDIEAISVIKSIQALQESDVAILVLSATEEISKQDKRIARMAVEEGKGLIILLNKADLLDKDVKAEKMLEIQSELHFCRFAPVLAVSAVTRDGLLKVFPLLETVARNRTRRISTKDLRRWFEETAQRGPAGPVTRSKHITQAADLPPTFILFVGNPKAVLLSHLKFLENAIRQTFAFEGTPIRWITKNKNSMEG